MIAHALVFHLKSLAPVWSALTWDTPIFVFLGVTRGFSLANSMDAFRSHSMFKGLGAPMSSIPAQILIGLFSSCGSGVMYKWMMEAWNECRSGTGMEVQTIEKKSGEMKRKSKEVKELDDVPVPKTQGLYGHPGFDLNLCLSVAAINVCLTYPIIPLQILENVHSLIPIIPDSLRLLFQSQLSKGEIAVLCTLITSAAPLLKSK